MTVNGHSLIRLIGLLAVLTGAAIGLIDGFQDNPLLYWPWALPVIGAMICIGLLAHHLVEVTVIERKR